ncbi:MAG: glycoside-pentoside-hexuronide (GPH):cation symporter [Prevotella sp.]|nr:glycoside-pentoside-hexuronide (GPH):cation symporter [Prevotella sp.]
MKKATGQGISVSEKVGYSLGDVSANLVFQIMMVYQLKFYTDIFGLDGTIAGTVLLFAPLASAVIDPLVGIVTDRTHTRWGKYRPWLLWTAVPFSLFYFLAFHNPGIHDKTLVAVYATVSYVLLLAMYGFNNTPYASLGGVMSGDPRERNSINTFRFVAAAVAQFVVQGLTLPLVDKLGGGNVERGWTFTIGLFAIFVCVFSLITFFSTRERIAPPKQQKMSIREDIRKTFSCTPWRCMFFLTLILYIALAMWSSSMNYYFQNYIDPQALTKLLSRFGWEVTPHEAYTVGFSVFNTVNAVVQFFGILFLSSFFANRYGKRTTFLVGLTLFVLLTAMFYIASPENPVVVFVICFLRSLVFAPTIPLLWAMVADSADFVEYTYHRRATGFCFSGIVFALKGGMGIGAALAGLLLSLFGYHSGSNEVQTQSAVQGIRLASSIIPALLLVGAVFAIWKYPITKTFNEKMQAELEARRSFEKLKTTKDNELWQQT